MAYYSEFEPINLVNVFSEFNDKLNLVGQLYDNNGVGYLTNYQKYALDLHNQGYDLGEQIYDLYSELGGVLQAMKSIN